MKSSLLCAINHRWDFLNLKNLLQMDLVPNYPFDRFVTSVTDGLALRHQNRYILVSIDV